MLKFNWFPKASWKLVQNLPININSLLDMIFLCTPWNLIISSIKTPAIYGALYVVLTSMKWALFVNVSTTTNMESCLLEVIGNPTMNSIHMTSHLDFGISWGCNNLAGCLCSTFTHWDSKNISTKFTMSFFIPFQKKSGFRSSLIFLTPKCAMYTEQCDSFKIN